MSSRVIRGAALACSVSLGLFVVVNAQFGCDSPSSKPPATGDTPVTGDKEPASTPDEATPDEAAPDEAPSPKPVDGPAVEPAADPETSDAATPTQAVEPVYMPASKSGGDFGAMQFPGEKLIDPQQPTNAAPEK